MTHVEKIETSCLKKWGLGDLGGVVEGKKECWETKRDLIFIQRNDRKFTISFNFVKY